MNTDRQELTEHTLYHPGSARLVEQGLVWKGSNHQQATPSTVVIVHLEKEGGARERRFVSHLIEFLKVGDGESVDLFAVCLCITRTGS